MVPRIAITPGEPAGIGPDILLKVIADPWPAEIVVVADPDLLASRAAALGQSVDIQAFDADGAAEPARPGRLLVATERMHVPATPGRPDSANAAYVLNTLERAVAGCEGGVFSAMVTGPVNKAVIADAGIPFTGHTEWLAARTHARDPVMMLVADELRVALVTTHLALREVPAAIDQALVERVLRILDADLRRMFGIASPRIVVLGLNPHAGESGHLGDEERIHIEPALENLRAAGLDLVGPLPADTAFMPPVLRDADAVLAMFHDQGLPVLKYKGFGHAVNVTLGLPIIRTSVDHGTALDLAGTGLAEDGSLRAALQLAIELQTN